MWFQTEIQWNNVARCANFDPLCFHDFALDSDSMKFKCDDSKEDKEGEKLTEKNTHANAFNCKVCWFNSASTHFALNSDKHRRSDKIFKKKMIILLDLQIKGTKSNY